MARIFKTPMLLKRCSVPLCELGSDFTIKNDRLEPIGYVCAKHAFLLKLGDYRLSKWREERETEQAEDFRKNLEDGDLPPGDDANDGSGNSGVH